MKIRITCIAFSIAVLVTTLCALQQELINSPDQPIELSQVGMDGAHPNILILNIKNKTSEAIAAYGLLIKLKDETGKTVLKTTNLAMKSLGPSDQGMAPGATVQHKTKIPVNNTTGKTPQGYEITVDFVAFQNGSTWGKDEMKMSRDYAQLKSGAALERARQKRWPNPSSQPR